MIVSGVQSYFVAIFFMEEVEARRSEMTHSVESELECNPLQKGPEIESAVFVYFFF